MLNDTRSYLTLQEHFNCDKQTVAICCKDCDFQTDLVINLNDHIREYHTTPHKEGPLPPKASVKRYLCAKCNFETFFSLTWLHHVKTACLKNASDDEKLTRKKKRRKCEYTKLHKAQNCAKDGQVTWYSCDQCSYKGRNERSLKRHAHNCHLDEEDIKWHHCDQCAYKSKFPKDLRSHKISRHLKMDEITWFRCHHCSHATKFKGALKSHIFSVHRAHLKEDVFTWFQCDHCSYVTKFQSKFKRHVSAMHGPKKDKKPAYDTTLYECEQCSVIFNSAQTLRVHMKRKHSDEKNFKWHECDQCSHRSRSATELKTHKIYKHLKDDEVEWFHCTNCEYRAKFKHELNKHVLHRHTLKGVKCGALMPKPFHCEKCPLSFTSRQFLRRHINDRHTDEKDIRWFECDQCTYKSKRKYGVVEHKMRRHRSKNAAS